MLEGKALLHGLAVEGLLVLADLHALDAGQARLGVLQVAPAPVGGLRPVLLHDGPHPLLLRVQLPGHVRAVPLWTLLERVLGHRLVPPLRLQGRGVLVLRSYQLSSLPRLAQGVHQNS